jgi:hypothetical protein
MVARVTAGIHALAPAVQAMTHEQELWRTQAAADLALFRHLAGTATWKYQCHALQALQMASEKIAKASFRVSGRRPKTLTHLGLSRFLRRLGTVRGTDQRRLAAVFGASSFSEFERLLRRVRGVAYEIEKLPPAVAGLERVNTEYPWPDLDPQYTPAAWDFAVWTQLTRAEGRAFLRFLSRAIERFPAYADVFR